MYCSVAGPVCGRDYQEYHSECAAHSNNVLVDHFTACNSSKVNCAKMDCPDEYVNHLRFNQCPFCGSVAYFIYDRHYFDNINNQVDSEQIKRYLVENGVINIHTISKQLQDLVYVNHCRLYAYIFAPGYLTVMIDTKYDSDNKVLERRRHICRLELKRIKLIIRNKSPLTQISFPLSLLQYNEQIEWILSNTKRSISSNIPQLKVSNILLTICVLVLLKIQ